MWQADHTRFNRFNGEDLTFSAHKGCHCTKCDLFNKMLCHTRPKVISALTMLTRLPVTQRHVSSSKPAITLHVQPSCRAELCHDSICPLNSMCTHLTWNKMDNTIQSKPIPRQKSHSEPYSSTHWWDRLTLQHTEGEVRVRQPATIISSCHYLPSYSQL